MSTARFRGADRSRQRLEVSWSKGSHSEAHAVRSVDATTIRSIGTFALRWGPPGGAPPSAGPQHFAVNGGSRCSRGPFLHCWSLLACYPRVRNPPEAGLSSSRTYRPSRPFSVVGNLFAVTPYPSLPDFPFPRYWTPWRAIAAWAGRADVTTASAVRTASRPTSLLLNMILPPGGWLVGGYDPLHGEQVGQLRAGQSSWRVGLVPIERAPGVANLAAWLLRVGGRVWMRFTSAHATEQPPHRPVRRRRALPLVLRPSRDAVPTTAITTREAVPTRQRTRQDTPSCAKGARNRATRERSVSRWWAEAPRPA
jgi:hypothetical protein